MAKPQSENEELVGIIENKVKDFKIFNDDLSKISQGKR